MKDGFDFDGALKDVFQEDRPTLLKHLTRGLAARETPVDLSGGVPLWGGMPSCGRLPIGPPSGAILLLLWNTAGGALRRQAKPAIVNRLEEDDLRFSYGVMDIREIEADALMKRGNHGDLALALLA